MGFVFSGRWASRRQNGIGLQMQTGGRSFGRFFIRTISPSRLSYLSGAASVIDLAGSSTPVDRSPTSGIRVYISSTDAELLASDRIALEQDFRAVVP